MYKTEISKKPTTQKTIELLLMANIDKKTKDRTPLHHAVATNNENEVKLLLDKKPDLEARDNEGRTPLHLAVVREGYEAVAKLLLDANADVEAKDNYGKTPMHLAAQYSDENMVKLLLENGANYKATTHGGMTPAQVAQKNGKAEIATFIPSYHQKLKPDVRGARQENLELKKIIKQQEEEIKQLKEQLSATRRRVQDESTQSLASSSLSWLSTQPYSSTAFSSEKEQDFAEHEVEQTNNTI